MADNGRIPRRILHTADLHLERLNDKACHSFEALVDVAIEAKVDLVIIAGDLFDHNRVDDRLVSFVVEQLQRLSVGTVILPGNHDYLLAGSVYNRAELWQGATNVRVLRAPQGEILALPGLGVSVWGKPIVSDDGDIRPLAGMPLLNRDGQWHIAVAHGYYVSAEPSLYQSFCITQEEVVASNWDYIALGHLSVFRCICDEPVKAYYCDSPSLFGTVTIVDLAEETGVQVTRYSLRNK